MAGEDARAMMMTEEEEDVESRERRSGREATPEGEQSAESAQEEVGGVEQKVEGGEEEGFACASPDTEARALHALRSPSVPVEEERARLQAEWAELEARREAEQQALREERERFEEEVRELAVRREEVDELLRACEEQMSALESRRAAINRLLLSAS
eukprot:1339573-Rhodomonas_salina.1